MKWGYEDKWNNEKEWEYGNAINGYTGELGMMPAKGGNPALSDEEVKAAVEYIISETK